MADYVQSGASHIKHGQADGVQFMAWLFEMTEVGQYWSSSMQSFEAAKERAASSGEDFTMHDKTWPQHLHEVDRLAGIATQSALNAVQRMDWGYAEPLLALLLLIADDFFELRKAGKRRAVEHKRVWESIEHGIKNVFRLFGEQREFI
jgi:hypothetical protein